jgi:hypothetical protein
MRIGTIVARLNAVSLRGQHLNSAAAFCIAAASSGAGRAGIAPTLP